MHGDGLEVFSARRILLRDFKKISHHITMGGKEAIHDYKSRGFEKVIPL